MDNYEFQKMNQAASRFRATLGGEPVGPGDDMYNDRIDNVRIKDEFLVQNGTDEAGNPVMANPLNMITGAPNIPKTETQSTIQNIADFVESRNISLSDVSSWAFNASNPVAATINGVGADAVDYLSRFATATPEQQKEMALPNQGKAWLKNEIHKMTTATEIEHTKLYEDFFYGPKSAQHDAEAYRLEKETGIKSDLFSNDPELYKNVSLLAERMSRMKRMPKYRTADGKVDMQKIVNDIPGLADVLKKQGTSAGSLVLHNIEGMQTIGNLYKDDPFAQFGAGVGAGVNRLWATIRRTKLWASPFYEGRRLNEREQKELEEIENSIKNVPKYSYDTALGTAGAFLGGAAENANFMLASWVPRGIAAGAVIATKGKGAKTIDKIATGVSLATMAGMIAPLQYEELVSKMGDDGNYTYTPEQAKTIAIAQSIPQAVLEDYGMMQMGNFIFGKGAPKSIFDIVKRSESLDAMRAGVKDYLKYTISTKLRAGIGSYGAELAEEFEQGVSDRVVENIAQILINGKEADVKSINEILIDSTADAAQAMNAVAGFGLAGLLLSPIANTRALWNFRNNVRMATSNRMLQGQVANAHFRNILSGVWENKGQIRELHDKAPDVEATILDAHNKQAGIEYGFVDVKEIRKTENGEAKVQEIAQRNNISQEELAACLDGSGMLRVKTSTLMQMDVKEAERQEILDNVTTELGAFTETQKKTFLDVLKTQMEGVKNFNDKTYKEAIDNIIKARFTDAEQAKLAREIIETNYDNPYGEFRQRLNAINTELWAEVEPFVPQLREALKQNGIKLNKGETFREIAVKIANGQEDERFNIPALVNTLNEMRTALAPSTERLTQLVGEREKLLALQDRFKQLRPGEIVATATLSAEGLKVYDTVLAMMEMSENKKLHGATARANALMVARMADNMAKAYKAARKVENYTAEDYMKEFFRLDVNAVYNEAMQDAAQLLQRDRYAEFLTEDDLQNLEKEGNEFVNALNDSSISQRTILKVTSAPEILKRLGFQDSDIVISKALALNTMKPEVTTGKRNHQHGLTIGMLQQLPKALHEPIFIFKSATRNDSIVVFTEVKDNKNRSIIVPIVFSKAGGKIDHTITSIYGRNAEYNFAVKQFVDDNGLYISTKKGPAWAKKSRLQLPRTLLKQSLSLELSIAKDKGIVNGKNNIGKLFQVTQEPNLVAYHNMSEDSLLKSAALGGLPVPSIAVTKKDTPFNQFGQITLIGGSDIVDPAKSGNDVYSQDAWTVTFPETVYDKVKVKDIRAFADDVKDAFNALGGDSKTQLSEFVYKLQNNHMRRYMQTDLYNSLAMRYKYVKDVLGETVKIPTKKVQVNEEYILKNKKIREAILDFGPQPNEEQKKKLAKLLLPVLKEYAKTIPTQKSNTITINGETYTDRGPSFDGRQIVNSKGEKQSKEIVYAITNLLHYNDVEKTLEHLREVAQKTTPVFPKLAQKAIEFIENAKIETDDLQNQFVSAFFDKDGSVNERIYYNLLLNARLYGKTEVDDGKLRKSLEKKIAKNEKGYNDYINQQLDRLYRNPKIMIGNKKADITLDNIVEAMMKKRGAGKEDSIVFNNHKALASMAKKFKSLDEIRKNKNRLTDSEKAELSYKVYEEAGDKYREVVGPYYKYGITFDTYDDANKAVVDAAKAGGSESAIRNALRRNNFKEVPANVVESMKAVLEAAKDVQTDYFEAKPLRAVGFNEFAAAVVPNGTKKETIDYLKSQGLTVTKYNPNVPGDRAAKTQQAAQKANVYFQQQNIAKGAISVNERNQRIIQLFTGSADQSTFIHEMAHMFLMDLQNIAGIDPNSKQAKDLETIMSWAEYKPGQAEEYKGTASYEEFRKREEAIKEAEAKGDTAEAQRLKYVWAQERFARAFEEYLRTGEAPARGLKKAFRDFKKWLTEIYNDVTGAGVRATPEVEAIMARIVASEEEIETLEAQNSIARKIADANIMPDSATELIKQWQEEAKEEAKEKLLKELIKAFEKNVLQDINMKLKELREQTTAQLQQVPCFICEQMLKSGADLQTALTVNGFESEQAYKDALKEAGGSLNNAVNTVVKAERQKLLTQMPSNQELYNMAEEAINSGDYNARMSELEADILRELRDEYNSIPAKLRRAFEEIDKNFSEEISKETWEAFKRNVYKLKYAERWAAQEFILIKEFEDAVNAVDEPNKTALENLRKKYDQLKEKTLRNKEWINGIGGATRGKTQAIKASAERHLSEETVSVATNPRYWHRQALAAAKRAWDGLKKIDKGERTDYENAIMAKQEQALFDAMTAQAIKNQKQVDRWLNGRNGFYARSKRMADPKVKADANLRYCYNHLMYIFGIRNKDAIVPDGFKGIEELLSELRKSHQYEDAVPSWIIDAINAQEPGKNYQQLTMGQLQELKTITDIFYTLAKNQNELLTMDVSMDDVVADITVDFLNHVDYEVGNQKINEVKGAIGEYMNGLLTQERILALLGGEQGGFIKYLYRILFNATEAEEIARENEAKFLYGYDQKDANGKKTHVKGLYESFYTKKELRAILNDPVKVTDANGNRVNLSIGDDTEITKENLLCMALNWGTELNRARLCVGLFDCETDSQLAAAEAEMLNLLSEQLTEKDWQFVQAMWKHIDSFGDPVSEMLEKSIGVPLKREKATPFTVVLPDGKTIRMDGGYYPIVRDYTKSKKQTEFDQLEEAKALGGVSVLGVGMGSTKLRADDMLLNLGPLNLSFDVIDKHINAQIHMINMKMAVRDAYKVLNNQAVSGMIERTCGKGTMEYLNEWALNCWAPPIRPREWYEKWAAKIRQNTISAIMAYRAMTALLNPANVVYMAQEIGVKNAIIAMAQYYQHPVRNRQMILDVSVFMRNRAMNMDRDLAAQQDKFLTRHDGMFGKFGNIIDKATGGRSEELSYMLDKYANWMIEETDMMVSLPMYKWQFEQTYSEEIGKGVPEEQARETANYEATRRVTKVFGSSRAVDTSHMRRSKDELIKLITPFFTFANTMWNAVWTKYYEGKFSSTERVQEVDDNGRPVLDENGEPKYTTVKKNARRRYVRFVRAMFFNYVLGALVETWLRQIPDWLAGGGDDDDEDRLGIGILSVKSKDWLKNSINSAAAGFPVANILTEDMTGTLLEGRRSSGRGVGVLSGTIGRYTTAAYDLVKLANDKGNTDLLDFMRDATRVANAFTGTSDTVTDAIFNTVRFIGDDYQLDNMDDLREYISKTIFDRKLKKK